MPNNKSTSKKKKTTNSKAKTSNQSTPKKAQTGAKKQNHVQAEEKRSNLYVASVVLFAVSLLFLVLYFVPGGAAWSYIRDKFLFGLFGFFSIMMIVLLMYVAFMCAKSRIKERSVKWQVFGWSFLILCINSFVHIVSYNKDYIIYNKITDQLKDMFSLGFSIKNGGLFGCLVGGGITKLCESKVASISILLILIFTVFMLCTKTTLTSLKNILEKPIKKINDKRAMNEKFEEDNYYEDDDSSDFTPEYNDYTPENDMKNCVPYEMSGKSRKIKQIDIEESRYDYMDDMDIIMPEPIDLSAKKKSYNPNEIKPINIEKEEDRNTSTEKKKTTAKTKTEKPKETDFEEKNNPFITSGTSFVSDKAGKSVLYKYPPLSCLSKPSNDGNVDYSTELKNSGKKLVETLRSFGVETRISEICRGPSVTRYEITPAPGVKISKITGLADDIAMNMASSGVRIEAPIPNKAAVGIEIPNRNRSMVSVREIIDSDVYSNAKSKLNVALGKDITGNIICADLAKMPHLLIAGTTGSGKSVCLNAMIISLLYNATPDEVKLLMIDPKQVEFTVYNGIPHLLVPVVSDPRKSAGALSWAVTEMLNRYKLFSERNVRDIKGYNKFCEANPEIQKLPQIVIFIDELSDLMMAAPNEVEDSICRLAQMARAAGMHLVIATQRPSVDVITGIIKANIPSRISLSVSSQVDSRTIIDTAGAEKLLGNGDMLFSPVGMSKPLRVQGAFLSDSEVENVVDYIKGQSQQSYDEDIIEKIENHQLNEKKKAGFEVESDDDDADEMLPKAIEVVVDAQMASTTLLQKKLKLGYARASRIIDSLEERGIVGPFQGSKPREVLLSKQQYHEMIALSDDVNIDLRNNVDVVENDDSIDEDEF